MLLASVLATTAMAQTTMRALFPNEPLAADRHPHGPGG
ncbi:putative protein without homology [Propionibacterium freudenreichii subsp. shermanii]|nr:putative protein without homology [Propionibacterium freudenreichii subsp. shermanii]